MPDIKLKEKSIIKQLDKKVVQTQNFKNNLVTTKERLNEFTSKKENTSAENYASNQRPSLVVHSPSNAGYTDIRCLVQENPTCHGETKPVNHSY